MNLKKIKFYTLPLVIITIIVFTAYYQTLVNIYGFADDYRHLFRAVVNDQYFPENIIVQGRPLYALLIAHFFRWTETISGLIYIRFITVLSIVFLAVYLFRCYYKESSNYSGSLTASIITVLTPAFGLYAAWASTFQVPLASLIALIACEYSLKDPKNITEARKNNLATILLLVISLQLYQPAASFYFVGLGLEFLGNKLSYHDFQEQLTKVIKSFVIFVGGCGLFYLIYKSIAFFYILQDSFYLAPASRGRLSFNLLQNLTWFMQGPLWRNLTPIFIHPDPWISSLTLGLILVGIYLRLIRSKITVNTIKFWIALLVIIALPVLTHFHQMFLQVPLAGFRIELALSAMIVLYLFHGVSEIINVISYQLPLGKKVKFFFCLLLLTFSLTVTEGQVEKYIIEPNSMEYQLFKDFLEQVKVYPVEVQFIRTPPGSSLVENSTFEYGSELNASLPQVVEGMVWLILREHLGNEPVKRFKFKQYDFDVDELNRMNSILINEESLFINGKDVIREKSSWRQER